jgi:hypothetical protein
LRTGYYFNQLHNVSRIKKMQSGTRVGLVKPAAILLTDKDEVLVARIVCTGIQRISTCLNIVLLDRKILGYCFNNQIGLSVALGLLKLKSFFLLAQKRSGANLSFLQKLIQRFCQLMKHCPFTSLLVYIKHFRVVSSQARKKSLFPGP